jgi:hypothetical protein
VNWGLLATFAVVGFCCMCVGWSGGYLVGHKFGETDGWQDAKAHYLLRIGAQDDEIRALKRRRAQSPERPAWTAPPPPPRIRAKTGAFITPQATPEPSPDTASLPAVRLAMASTGEMRAVTDAWIAAHTTGDAS